MMIVGVRVRECVPTLKTVIDGSLLEGVAVALTQLEGNVALVEVAKTLAQADG